MTPARCRELVDRINNQETQGYASLREALEERIELEGKSVFSAVLSEISYIEGCDLLPQEEIAFQEVFAHSVYAIVAGRCNLEEVEPITNDSLLNEKTSKKDSPENYQYFDFFRDMVYSNVVILNIIGCAMTETSQGILREYEKYMKQIIANEREEKNHHDESSLQRDGRHFAAGIGNGRGESNREIWSDASGVAERELSFRDQSFEDAGSCRNRCRQ